MKKLLPLILFISCHHAHDALKGSYAYDAAFLQSYTQKVIELKSPDGNAKLLLSGDYQGRVMTSTATGDTGVSFGWINYDLIAAPQKKKQFNPVGGEERFWLGPEGGQYSLYFKGGDSFNIAHWQVPEIIDVVPFRGMAYGDNIAVFQQNAVLSNYSGTQFNLSIEREIRLLDKKALEEKLQTAIPEGLHFVAFETINSLYNTGDSNWTKEKGLPSVWLLGMFTPSPQTKVIIPFNPIPGARDHITSTYFGAVPPERLQVKDSMLYFTCDGKYRSKIGLSPAIARPMAAGFDAAKNVLTVVIPQVDKNASYVNSKWELQQEPYKGDVINSYNDGPLADGSQLGPFYEIESSSPAMELAKGQKGVYRQTTCHFQGSYETLKALGKKLGLDF